MNVVNYDIPMLNRISNLIPDGNDESLTCLEVGCVPGRFLLYFNKIKHYSVEGVDYSGEIEDVNNVFLSQGITNFHLYKSDFFNFNPNRSYDLVCSFGFVEHFENTSEVIQAHSNHVKPGGYLLLTIPNVKYLQKAFIEINDPNMLSVCNLDSMDPVRIRGFLEEGYEIKYAGYLGTCRVYGKYAGKSIFWKAFSFFLKKMSSQIDKILSKFNVEISNRYTSPMIAVVAKKRCD